MSDEYKKVVNLQSSPAPKQAMKKSAIKQKTIRSKAEEIDKVFADQAEESSFERINRPQSKNVQTDFFKQLSIFLLLVIIGLFAYYFFVEIKNEKSLAQEAEEMSKQEGWYAVELSNGDLFYGFIKNTKSDPVVLENVYYNYNQIADKEDIKVEDSSASIRLVKRGKEAHGPNGTMSIVRSQVVFMEPLAEQSKILKAILDYEN